MKIPSSSKKPKRDKKNYWVKLSFAPFPRISGLDCFKVCLTGRCQKLLVQVGKEESRLSQEEVLEGVGERGWEEKVDWS